MYRLPLPAVGYSLLVSFVPTVVFVTVDFKHYKEKHKLLERLLTIPLLAASNLPQSTKLIESDYQKLICLLDSETRAQSDMFTNKYNDMIDYYTIWAHQIKTPISAMRLLLQSNDTEENVELKSELLKIEQYVEMVLCYLRLDSSSTDYVIRNYPLDGIIKKAVRKYASQFIRKKISLVYDGTDITVLTDEKWLLFVIDQVLSNALKYTREGSITITVDDKSNLYIKDTGIGISPSDLPRIFEKGYTGCNGRWEKSSSGIGLYLCRRITKRLCHTIEAFSDEGKGTTIKIGLGHENITIE